MRCTTGQYLYIANFMKSIATFLATGVMLGLFAVKGFAAGVDTLQIQSKVMQKVIKAAVVLPDAYKGTHKTFPVF